MERRPRPGRKTPGLRRRGGGALPPSLSSAGITSGGGGLLALFASHPPIEARIAALQSARA